MIVATGLLYYHGRKTEIVDLNNYSFHCDGLPDFPIDIAYAAGGMVNGIPIICGGANSRINNSGSETIQTTYKECYAFQKRAWIKIEKSLDEPKFLFGTGNLVIKDKLLIHGGLTEDIQDTTFSFANSSELIGFNTHTSKKVTFPVAGHCNIMINETHFMVTGGLVPYGKSSEVTNKTYYCQTDLNKCIPGPYLNYPRRAHGCFQMTILGKPYLFVIGGYIDNKQQTSNDVEYLDMSDMSKRQWIVGEFSKFQISNSSN